MVGLGKKDRSKDSSKEGHDLSREAVRTAISKGKGCTFIWFYSRPRPNFIGRVQVDIQFQIFKINQNRENLGKNLLKCANERWDMIKKNL